MEFEIGTKVTWETVNGPRTGVVINHREVIISLTLVTANVSL